MSGGHSVRTLRTFCPDSFRRPFLNCPQESKKSGIFARKSLKSLADKVSARLFSCKSLKTRYISPKNPGADTLSPFRGSVRTPEFVRKKKQEPTSNPRAFEGTPWAAWFAAELNQIFREHGATGQSGRLTAATVRHGEKLR